MAFIKTGKTAPCPECKGTMEQARSERGSLIWACANGRGHSGGAPLIFRDRAGDPEEKETRVTGICPGCGQKIERLRSRATGKPFWACFNESVHGSRPAFYDDDNGRPGGERGAA